MKRALLFALLGLVLAACASGNQPFSKEGPTDTQPKGKTPPAIVIRSLKGMPPGLAGDFRTALAVAAGQHDIGIVEGDLPGGTYKLEGTFQAEPGRITWAWVLRDFNDVIADQSTGEVPAAGAQGADPWAQATPQVVQQIASKTAQNLALKLAALGFATRVSSLATPPWQTFAAAGPGAKDDIDYETLNGPGAVDPTEVAAIDQPVESAALDAAPEPEPQPTAKPGPNATVIKAVAVVPVKGGPGNGNQELTDAMRRALKTAGWPVITAPRKDALTIAGKVELAAATGSTQQVKVNWLVTQPSGKTLGEIKQANEVQAGSLDQGFGPAATAVAEAAATGIFDLIRKYR